MARHLRLAGRDDEALDFLVRAAEHARSVAALNEAAAFLAEALEIRPGDPELLLGLAEASMWLGRRDDGEARFAEAMTGLEGGDPWRSCAPGCATPSGIAAPQCSPHEVLASTRRAMEVLDRIGAQDVAERREALAGAAWAEGVAGDIRTVR